MLEDYLKKNQLKQKNNQKLRKTNQDKKQKD